MMPHEPSGPIQIIPPGLLGMLQLKSPMGVNPSVLNNDVQPSLDMAGWWLRAQRETFLLAGMSAVVAVGATAFAVWPTGPVVPTNEWWYVHNASLRITTGAGTLTAGSRIAFQQSSVAGIFYPVGEQMRALAANDIAVATTEDFWVPPGSQIGYLLAGGAGANVTVNSDGLAFSRLRI